MSQAFRMEAEDFSLKGSFFRGLNSSLYSDDGFIFGLANKMGLAESKFTGDSGRYKVVVHYFDESDGASAVRFRVGNDVDCFFMDGRSGSSAASRSSMTERSSFDDIRIEKGDAIQIQAFARGRDAAAIDFIEFIPLDKQEEKADDRGAPSGFGAFEMEVLTLTNAIRQKAGLSTLRFDDSLLEAAEGHSRDMAEKRFFSHVSSDGDRLGDRARDAGYDSGYVGENIAAGFDTPQQVVDAWMRSSGHRANILNPKFNEIGVGFVEDDNSVYNEYWTQVFGYDASLV